MNPAGAAGREGSGRDGERVDPKSAVPTHDATGAILDLRAQHLWVVEFDGGPGTVAGARRAAQDFLHGLRHRLVPDDDEADQYVLLAVSELVTNAVRHAPGPLTLALDLVGPPPAVRVTVRDSSPALPRPRVGDPTGTAGGFGWPTLLRLSRLDVARCEGGKEISAVLSW